MSLRHSCAGMWWVWGVGCGVLRFQIGIQVWWYIAMCVLGRWGGIQVVYKCGMYIAMCVLGRWGGGVVGRRTYA